MNMNNIADLKKLAKSESIPIMQDEGIEFIKKYILNNNIKSILEIGSAVGYSAINFTLVKEDVSFLTIHALNHVIKEIDFGKKVDCYFLFYLVK